MSVSSRGLRICRVFSLKRSLINSNLNFCCQGLLLIIPAFFCVGLATTQTLLYLGLFLFAVSTSMVVPSTMTLVSQFGTESQKGTVMGIFRSLGALARGLGPVVASICYWSFGPLATYCIGGIALLWPWYYLRKNTIN